MKNLLYVLTLLLLCISCDNNDSDTDQQINNGFDLEGQWYVSGSTVGYLNEDSVSYSYKEKVIGYQEHIFEKVQKKDANYIMKSKQLNVKKKDDESDNDYVNRLMTGNFTVDDISIIEIDEMSWKVNGRDMYTYLWNREGGGLFLVAKIISCTKDQVKIASISPSLIDFSWNEPVEYKYYITLKRVP